MTEGFLDNRGVADSLLRRTSALWKLLLLVGGAATVASEPRGALNPFGYYAVLILLLAIVGRAEVGRWMRRWLPPLPFLLTAAVMPFFVDQPGVDPSAWAISILLRGLAVVSLLALLTETAEVAELVDGLTKLRLPGVWVTALVLAFRHVFTFVDEWRRFSMARTCRAPDLTAMQFAGAAANQLGLVFVRAWERSERVDAAMASRGFDGRWRLDPPPSRNVAGSALCVAFLGAFLCVRIYL